MAAARNTLQLRRLLSALAHNNQPFTSSLNKGNLFISLSHSLRGKPSVSLSLCSAGNLGRKTWGFFVFILFFILNRIGKVGFC
jgi:hypothetical protein